MELKSTRTNKSTTLYMFKSHLYGIEILKTLQGKADHQKFKSHLYGIEIKKITPRPRTVQRLNRTFMELK